MYTTLIAAGAGAAIGFLFCIGGILLEEFEFREGIGFGIAGAFFVGFIGAAIGFLISMCLGAVPGPDVVEQTRILALKDNASVEGTFFLGCGTINGVMEYYYLTYDGEGGYVTKHASTNCHIYEDEETLPYVKIYYRKAKFAPDWSPDMYGHQISKVEFHIPKGSVIKNYNVDLE